MLHFVIGVNTYSVPGGLIEKKLLQHFEPNQFEIIPIKDGTSPHTNDQKRVDHLLRVRVERLLEHNVAPVCIGITSSVGNIKLSNGKVLNRVRCDLGYGAVRHLPPGNVTILNREQIAQQKEKMFVEDNNYDDSLGSIHFMVTVLLNPKLTYKS